MKINNLLAFVIDRYHHIGLAVDGPLASSVWLLSESASKEITGSKFAWIGPDGEEYVEHRDNFIRPTEAQVQMFITPAVLRIAQQKGYIELEKVRPPKRSKADFEYKIGELHGQQILFIRDLNLGRMSVTNDIENVIADIAEETGIDPTTHFILYRDSMRQFAGWDAATETFYSLKNGYHRAKMLEALLFKDL